MADDSPKRLRVHEFARLAGIESQRVIDRLAAFDQYVRSASSMIEAPVLRRLADSFEIDAETLRKLVTAKSSTSAPSVNTGFQNEYGWHSGAVKPPRNKVVTREIESAQRRFHEVKEHRRILSLIGSQIIWASQSRDSGLSGCYTFKVRFSEAIESNFGLSREVLAVYVPFKDFQMRAFQAVQRELRAMEHSVTPGVVLIWAPDDRLSSKLAEWATPRAIPIPFQLDRANAIGVVEVLQTHLHMRNLFEATSPVTGSTFFGRKTILQSLRADSLHGQAAGIFGLRKAGKTSVLMELADQVRDDKTVPVLIDLEVIPSPPIDPSDDFLALLKLRIVEELKAAGCRVKELAELPRFPSVMEFKMAMQKLLRVLDGEGIRILLMLDEIEYITPTSVESDQFPRLAQALGALRSLTQESKNVSLLLAGLTRALFEMGELHGRPNPFFSWARPITIGPLSREDADDLAVSLGQRMGIFISEGALDALYEASGGHAYLYRNLASTVVKSLPISMTNRTMSRRDVLLSQSTWRAEIYSHIVDMIRHVEKFYPIESILLDALRVDRSTFNEFAQDEIQATRRLVELGLIEPSDDGYRPAAILELA